MTRETNQAYFFVAPAFTLVTLLALVPLIAVVWMSLRRVMPVFGIDRWASFANFAHLFSDSRFWSSLETTLYFAVVAVTLEIALGLGIALLLHRSFRGRGLARTAVLIPWALPTVVAARMWEWIYNPDFGIMNYLLQKLSLTSGPVSWLGDPFWAIHAAILADAWKTTPFAALILLAGLAAIPPDLARAARVDGAGSFRVFFEITLPLLRPALVVTALFRFLDSFRVFDAIYVLTGGGPANTTETLAVYIYKVVFQTLRFGYGSAIAVTMFLLAGAASVLIVGLAGRGAFGVREG
ncbi:MAG TPA: sugar ABC transporter permease [Vicinamibacteria bacterium]|jgi:multiple sugar transport system permease protein